GTKATSRLTVARDDPANVQALHALLRKTKPPAALWDHFLAISERRLLYLRALLAALALFEAGTAERLPRGSALIEALLDRLGRIYGKHAEHLYDISCTIAFAYEALSIEELCFLLSERFPSLRTAAFLRDINGMLRVDRSELGNVYSIGHEEVANGLRRRFGARHHALIRTWCDSLRGEIGDLADAASPGLDYFLAHIDDYAAAIGLDIFSAELVQNLVGYALREDAATPFLRRRRSMLLAAFRWLDRANDPTSYIATGARVPAAVLEHVLEQRLAEGDATLSALLDSADRFLAPIHFDFFRALAVSAYHTERYSRAVALGDRLYSLSGMTADLVNLALMLKGTDSQLDDGYTMSRARHIANQLTAGKHAHDLRPFQRGLVLYTVGRVFCDTLEHLHEAIPTFEESLLAFETAKDDVAALTVRNAIAISLIDIGDFSGANTLMQAVVAMMRDQSDRLPRHAYQAALVNSYILSFLANGRAEDELDTSTISKWEIRAYHLNNQFLVAFTEGNEAAAGALAAPCRVIVDEHRVVYSRAALLNNTGVIYGRREDLIMAHEICKKSGYSMGETITGCNLGLDYPVPKGVLRSPKGLLWPCAKNFDVLMDL